MGPEGLTTEKPMCLQDPFELKHNVCRNLPEKGVRALQSHFKAASQIFSQITPDERLVGGINALFGMQVEADKGEHSETSLEAVLVAQNEFVKKIFGNPYAKPASLPIGVNNVEELVTTVLKNCLLLRSNVKENGSENLDCNGSLKRGLSTEECVKKMKMQEKGNIGECTVADENIGEEDAEKKELAYEKDAEPRVQYKQVGGQWVVDGLVWSGRKKKAAMVAEELVVSREAAITRLVMEEQAVLTEPEVVFTCHLLTTEGQSGINSGRRWWVALQKVHSRKKSFESMVGWFNPYLTDLVSRLMKEKSAVKLLD